MTSPEEDGSCGIWDILAVCTGGGSGDMVAVFVDSSEMEIVLCRHKHLSGAQHISRTEAHVMSLRETWAPELNFNQKLTTR